LRKGSQYSIPLNSLYEKTGALSFKNILLLAGFEDRYNLRSAPLYWDLRHQTDGDQLQLVESRESLAISGIHGREFSRKSKKTQKMLPESVRIRDWSSPAPFKDLWYCVF